MVHEPYDRTASEHWHLHLLRGWGVRGWGVVWKVTARVTLEKSPSIHAHTLASVPV